VAVDAGERDFDQDLTRRGLRQRAGHRFKDFGTAGAGDGDRVHRTGQHYYSPGGVFLLGIERFLDA
jgi:hypothetical protein